MSGSISEAKRSLRGVLGQEQRLFSEGITCKYELLCRRIPEREGEHTAKPAYRIEVPGPVGLDKHLGVGGSCENVASAKSSWRSSM